MRAVLARVRARSIDPAATHPTSLAARATARLTRRLGAASKSPRGGEKHIMQPTTKTPSNNPSRNGANPPPAPGTANGSGGFELHELLHALQSMRGGGFSVRVAG